MRRTGAGKRKGSNGKKRHVEEVDEDEEIAELQEKYQVMETENPPGSQHPNTTSLKFEDMALSSKTKRGLADEGMVTATDIQAAALMHGLLRRDILGAAKTGSGKTLAFVIPLLERLFMEKWCSEDGLAALIITPTRELAMQIFDVLRKIGRHHPFSAGMITGGKKEFEEEQLRVVSMNILVATPGRLLQHLEVTPGFDASQLLLLVLDEADRILDMGFRTQLDGILDYLPPRQTLLFSATQTKSVKDLARLSLAHPEYLAVHSSDEQVTPASLTQNYIVCHLDQKLDTLYTFLKTHLTSKIIVFFSTCSQVSLHRPHMSPRPAETVLYCRCGLCLRPSARCSRALLSARCTARSSKSAGLLSTWTSQDAPVLVSSPLTSPRAVSTSLTWTG